MPPLESVCLTPLHQTINETMPFFSVSLKFEACYIMGQWSEFITKTPLYVFIYLFSIFLLFPILKFVFLSFSFLVFDEVSNFHKNRLTEIGVPILSVNLYSTTTISFEPTLCILIINGFNRKSKCLSPQTSFLFYS